ncbi:MAG: GuaB3 family dehydrogenase-related protein [Pseudonocardiales bacterium]|nr:GuaB3 family dehydrogenase-related protein [Pseudonocardiales bacterium]
MPDTVEIGLGRSARRGYHLDEIALVPTRRTRGSSMVSIAWQIDAHSFELPLITAPSDAIVSPDTAGALGALGGLGLLNGEGLWTRYDEPGPILEKLRSQLEDASLADGGALGYLQRLYAEPVKVDLLTRRIAEMRAAGGAVAVRVSPQHAEVLAPHAIAAGADILVIQGTVTSAEQVRRTDDGDTRSGLNLKTFIAALDIPVIVGGCANYQTALHLMRTGAAGVIIGYGAHSGSTTAQALGIDVPMATALIDGAAARRDYLEETGGRYVHLIAYGDTYTGGDIAKALACGADAVMLGEPLAAAAEAPGRGLYWDPTATHPRMPRSSVVEVAAEDERPSLVELLIGATSDSSGERSLFASVRRAMAKCGYSTVKEFQRAELILSRR